VSAVRVWVVWVRGVSECDECVRGVSECDECVRGVSECGECGEWCE